MQQLGEFETLRIENNFHPFGGNCRVVALIAR